MNTILKSVLASISFLLLSYLLWWSLPYIDVLKKEECSFGIASNDKYRKLYDINNSDKITLESKKKHALDERISEAFRRKFDSVEVRHSDEGLALMHAIMRANGGYLVRQSGNFRNAGSDKFDFGYLYAIESRNLGILNPIYVYYGISFAWKLDKEEKNYNLHSIGVRGFNIIDDGIFANLIWPHSDASCPASTEEVTKIYSNG